MNLCKNDCGFPENQHQYKQVPNKDTPEKKKVSNSRYLGKIKLLDGIWIELKAAHIDSAGDGKVSCLPTKESALVKPNGFRIDCTQFGPMNRKSNQRIISIRHLFSNAPKFQKNFSRGVFLTCLIYSEEKILVTFDDVLPTFQIDEDLSSSFQSDFHWLHKISCIWNDVKFLKSEMEKCDSASALHFRLKILQTIVTMQEALDLPDLGKVYYKPIITENNNVTFLCTVNHLRSTKLVSAPNVRWIPVEKLKCRKTISDTYEILLSSTQGLMIYHQMSNIPLGKGLYLGYFKLVSSVDLLKVFVPEKTPSILPHVKIRNNPHVTKEEWDLLSMLNEELQRGTIAEGQYANVNAITETQLQFRQSLDSSLKKLFSNLKIDRNSALNHRFYTTEIVEISSSVTFIMLLPPTDSVCLIEGDEKDLKWMEVNKLMTLPIQVFEMTHVLTYHNTLARRYMRLSATIEVETALGQHNKRKAFSSEEMSQAQHSLSVLSSLQNKLESTWKDCRWILEMVKAARAKEKTFATLRDFLNRYNTIQVIHSTNASISCTPSSSNASTPSRKFSRGTYVNTGSPYHLNHLNGNSSNNNNTNSVSGSSTTSASNIHNKNQFKTAGSAGGKSFPVPDLPGPQLPSNPNFKYESCSSLPIVSKNSPNYERLRTTASLHNLKLPNGGLFLNPMNSINNNCSSSSSNNDGIFLMSETSSVMQELDSYMRHTSSRSKLVSLSSMTHHKFKDNYGGLSGGGSFGEKDVIPGMNEPRGLKGLSWTKQRGSLDRCFSTESEPYYANTSAINHPSNDSSRDLQADTSGANEGGNESSRNLMSNMITMHCSNNDKNSEPSRIVAIYAAYDSGLSFGSCVKLQITTDTTSNQIVQLMIRKINEEIGTKSSSTGTESHTKSWNVEDFCLVSVIGARERVLRMDYNPLQLQNPWDSARLFVRRKTEVTAAVDLESTILANSSGVTV